MLPFALFVLHFAVTCAMGGIMWFVQLAYYPNLAVVGRDSFTNYQKAHIRRITRIAWTMLFIELGTGLALPCVPPTETPRTLLVLNAALLLAIWWSTWFVQVPLHQTLERGWEERAHFRLVRTNWFRTVLYTLRGMLLLYVLWLVVAP